MPTARSWIITHRIPGGKIRKSIFPGSRGAAIKKFNLKHRHSIMIDIEETPASKERGKIYGYKT